MQKVKIGVIVGALALALVLFLFNRGDEAIPVTQNEAKTLWLCGSCNHSYELNTKEEYEAAEKVPGQIPPLHCPSCKERMAYRALRCEECSTVYFGPDVPNSTGVCPKCNPDAKPLPPPEDIEEESRGVEEEGEEGSIRRQKVL